MIKHLRIRNYKSLKEVDLHPGPFMTLVGPNASGKSNFVDSLDFLSRCFRDGLPKAVAAKGGYENIAFRRARRAKAGIEFCIEVESRRKTLPKGKRIVTRAIQYSFTFRAKQQRIASEYEVTDEQLCVTTKSDSGKIETAQIDRKSGWPRVTDPDGSLSRPPGLFHGKISEIALPVDDLMLSTLLSRIFPLRVLKNELSQLAVFQISPGNTREPGDPSGRGKLDRFGKNLPAAIQHLKKNHRSEFKELLSHLQNAESSFTGIETDYTETRQLGLYVKEHGVGRKWYAKDLSDGTLQTIAVFIPLLDSRYSPIAIEEPENGLHPWVIKDFVETCREKSKQKQIILTTHSPMLVSHLRPSELLLVDRQEGATHIVQATEVDRDVDDIINSGVMDLGSYWNSGQMSAVPGGPSLFDLSEESKSNGQ